MALLRYYLNVNIVLFLEMFSGSLYQLFSVNGNIGISEDHYNRNKSSRLTNISEVESIFTGIFGTK